VLFYRDVPSPVHRLDARAKLIGLGLVFAALVIHSQPVLLLLSLLGLIALVGLGRVLARLARFAPLLTLLTVFSVWAWALTGRGEHALFWRVTWESLGMGVAAALKLDAMVVAAALLIATTRIEEISLALQKMKVPFALCFAFTMALGFIPGLLATADAVIQAQRGRGVDVTRGPFLQRARNYIPLLVPVILITIRNVNEQALALEAKGYGASRHRTFYLTSRFGWAEVLVCLALVGWLGVNVWVGVGG